MVKHSAESVHFDELLERTRHYSRDRQANLSCPSCGTPGLAVDDQSTPPVAMWYTVTCARCGLAETVHVPIGAHAHGYA